VRAVSFCFLQWVGAVPRTHSTGGAALTAWLVVRSWGHCWCTHQSRMFSSAVSFLSSGAVQKEVLVLSYVSAKVAL